MKINSYKILLSALMLLVYSITARADYSYSNAVAALSPVAYWPLEETNQPPSNAATNLGTVGSAYNGFYGSGMTLGVTGALVGDSDTAVSFNASSEVVVPYGSVLGIHAPFSAEVWAQAGSNPAGAAVVSAGNLGGTRSGWLIYNNVGGVWTFRLYNQNGANTSLSISGGVADSNWHHIVAVFDGTNGSLYIDGALAAGPTAATGFVPDPDSPLTIGGRSDGAFLYNGSIDEVAIYTNAISASDISAHYQNGTSATPSQSYSSLVLADKPEFYYRLDGTVPASTAIATNYGSLGATVNGTYQPGSTPATAGPAGQGFGPASLACTFNPAASGYVDCGTDSSLDITGPLTVVAWVKGAPADTGARFQSFLGRSDNSWRADFGSPGVLPDGTARWADGGNPDAFGNTFINDGGWHFFVGVYDGANNFVYIDGMPDGTNAATGGVAGDPAARMVIGGVGDYIPARLFKGSVAQVAVFSTALSPAQIQTLYYAGELAPSFSVQPPQTVAIGLGSSTTLAATVAGNPTITYHWYQGTTQLSDVPGNISGSTSTALTITNANLGNGGNYTLVANNSYGSSTSVVSVVTVTPSPDIVKQPRSNTLVYAGNQIGLNLSAIGATPLSYRWYQGTSPIGGATSTNLTITAIAGTNTYYCIVTNNFGSATSIVATVVAQSFVLPPGGFVVNFDAYDGAAADNFVGQGAYGDPGNNIWNPIGASGVATGLAFNSASNQTLVTATAIYGFSNTGIGQSGAGQVNGDPSWLLSTEYAVNGGSPGIGTSGAPEGQFTINNLPQGTYTVYLYGQNYDGTRGSIFSFATTNGGVADQGMNATDPAAQAGFSGSDSTSFVEGQTYVFFTNVVADATGAITINYVYNNLDPLLLTGEAPLDGVQVIATSVAAIHPTMSILATGGKAVISWVPTNGVLQASTNVAGPYNDVAGATSPYTNSVITSPRQQFFRVHVTQ
jgi:Concanavalin A-like lectin/glucanases superfamily/Immunoglobulin I-set domain